MKAKIFTANFLWFLYSATKTNTWKRAIRNVESAQATILQQLLSGNSGTEFGKKHCFDAIGSVEDFQKAVPIQSYEDALPYIDKIAAGAQNILTSDSVRRFGISSGSTKASKLVPYTASLLADFQEGINPWMYNLMKSHPRILGGKAYWSVTPVGGKQRYSSGGVPIGFDDERSYFGKFTQWVLGTVMATPSELAFITDMDTFRYVTLRFLLQERSLTWISVWNPTFLTLLLSPLEKQFGRLIEDVRTGSLSVNPGVAPEIEKLIRKALRKLPKRADELANIRAGQKTNIYEKIWPKLKLISCWAHGNSGEGVKYLRTYFPNVVIEPKGLIATEAFVSFPLRGEESALSVNSHFFEFERIEDKAIALAHQLEIGEKYSVIVTTSGGFYRYQLNDIIEVLGFEAECPLIRFVGKQDKVVDICGEKLNEQFVRDVIRQVISQFGFMPIFWMVAPERLSEQVAGYTLFVQFKRGIIADDNILRMMCEKSDHALRENYHYDYCRRLGQLGHPNVFLIDADQDAFQVYLSTCAELGQRLGDIKSVALHQYFHWSSKFQGSFLTEHPG
ncbi:MAG: GH3 auxin-responsive promoter family protein [bacterium]|nr:GH3 auxin-responsive promoter family protein [bacterium]